MFIFIYRLFHSLMNLKKIIIDSAHVLILKDQEMYSYNPSTPFFIMVSSEEAMIMAWQEMSRT